MQTGRDWEGKTVEVFGVAPAIVECSLRLGNASLTFNNNYACWFYLCATGKIACK